MAVSELRDLARRVRAWLHAPHFLQKNAIVGAVLLVAEMILIPPASPAQMLRALSALSVSSASSRCVSDAVRNVTIERNAGGSAAGGIPMSLDEPGGRVPPDGSSFVLYWFLV